MGVDKYELTLPPPRFRFRVRVVERIMYSQADGEFQLRVQPKVDAEYYEMESYNHFLSSELGVESCLALVGSYGEAK